MNPEIKFLSKAMDFYASQRKIGKNLRSQYRLKFINNTKKSETDALKTASQRLIRKTAEATGDLVGKKLHGRLQKLLQRVHAGI